MTYQYSLQCNNGSSACSGQDEIYAEKPSLLRPSMPEALNNLLPTIFLAMEISPVDHCECQPTLNLGLMDGEYIGVESLSCTRVR